MKKFEVNVDADNEVHLFDFIDTDKYFDWSYHGFNGDLKFKKLPIKYFKNSSNIIKFVKNYGLQNNIDIVKYDIYYKKEKEWYSKLYFYLL